MRFRDGMTRPFTDFRAGDPFVLRDFSEKLHGIVQNELGLEKEVFPRVQRIAESLRQPVEKHTFGKFTFGKFTLRTDNNQHQDRLILDGNEGDALPYVCSEKQKRGFVLLADSMAFSSRGA